MAIKGVISLPGDKSISHRTLLFSPFTRGKNIIHNISTGLDVESTRQCLLNCGIKSNKNKQIVEIFGSELSEPKKPLDCGNSGTTARLLVGLIAGNQINATIFGDKSLSSRPMNRIIKPLEHMGAKLVSKKSFLPIEILSSKLNGINYKITVASAQVKSCLILAALGAKSPSHFKEVLKTRDHTEIMLKNMGAEILVNGKYIEVLPTKKILKNYDITVPGDPSSAAFFIGAALIIPNSNLILKNILFNPSRIGFIRVLKRMNAQIQVIKKWKELGELVADIQISYSQLNSIDLKSKDIPAMIDELPIFALIASQADGITTVKGAKELRHKESDRIKSICNNLKNIGVKIIELKDGFVIEGPSNVTGGKIKSFNDHRIAMTFEIAKLLTSENIIINNTDCINISFPEFKDTLNKINNS
ncbi:MAG: 3-phosphoshikimate 1-carboxyvinyltransferase [Candidatus Marinimicrobia bacterium]|nr:3-phosphoshikimate 1-carboxyvinyltransferase [Candidatus Neomarinimicrobiota bacterium]